MKNFFYLFLIALAFNSCGTIAPVNPAIIVERYTPPVQAVSTMSIPVSMEMKSYFKDADRAVPYQFKGGEQNCDGVSYTYTFDREPFTISGNSRKSDPLIVDIEIDGKYALNLNYCPKCTDLFSSKPECIIGRVYASCGVGEPMRRIKIEYETSIDLKSNYKLDATTKLKEITPKDRCEFTILKYNATEKLVNEVKVALKELGKEIDKEIEAIEIRSQIETIWQTFLEPFALQGYGFLYIDPENIGIRNLKMNGTKLQFEVLVEAFPKVTLIKRDLAEKKLPNLANLKEEKGFNINIDLIADYDSLSGIMNSQLTGKVIDIKKKKIILGNTKIYGASNRQLNIEVTFTGSKSGKMYFKGTPSFNDSLQELSFPDLNFELETKSILLKSAKWLFNDKITSMIKKSTTFNMNSVLKDAAKMIEDNLNQDIEGNIKLSGKVKSMKVSSIHPDSEKLLIQTNLLGNLNVTIK
jgi:hypothetical protein